MYSLMLCTTHTLSFLTLISHIYACMHTCHPVPPLTSTYWSCLLPIPPHPHPTHPHVHMQKPACSPSCTHAHPYAYTHPILPTPSPLQCTPTPPLPPPSHPCLFPYPCLSHALSSSNMFK